MGRDNAVAIYHGMLGGDVDSMIKQVIGREVECAGCRGWFTVSSENLYGVEVEGDDVARFPLADDNREWKVFLVCDENAHALRVDEWAEKIPGVVQTFP